MNEEFKFFHSVMAFLTVLIAAMAVATAIAYVKDAMYYGAWCMGIALIAGFVYIFTYSASDNALKNTKSEKD